VIGRLLAVVLPLVALAIAAVMLVPAAMGLDRYVITSGSMAGSYDQGSIVFDRVVARESLRVGDVVTFAPPGAHDLVTHRIVEATRGADGLPAFRTKGDANTVVDPWTFTPTRAELPKVVGSIPYLGYVFAALDVRWIRTVVIAIPALLVALALLAGPWSEGARPARRTVA
jgi:signal peptidase